MQRLEKADVLEVTVRHLRDLKSRGRLAAGTDITSTATFRRRAGGDRQAPARLEVSRKAGSWDGHNLD